MVWHVAIGIFKPFVFLWMGLNALDDFSLVMRLGRLTAAVIPLPGRNNNRVLENPLELCDVCDDVMGDLLRGTQGLSVVPCGAACLGATKCVAMCERLKTTSEETTEYPCIAAGYCDASNTDLIDVDPECHAGPFFSCLPRQYCRRKRQGAKISCDLRPGIGRWVGMKHAARDHAVSIATGLMSQHHCGEKGAGKYCIAKPTGLGAIAEVAGHVMSLVFGGYRSVLAIESPGGSDDRQWLTFWLIYALTLFCERFFARVILSTFHLYYEVKFALLVWLMLQSGAESVYRRLRRTLTRTDLLLSDEKAAARTLAIMKAAGSDLIEKKLLSLSKTAKEINRAPSTEHWEYDEQTGESSGDGLNATRQLYHLSKFLLSAEGAKALEDSDDISEQEAAQLVERAAEVVSFQPRFLCLRLEGMVDGPEGDLPPMDRNGKADAYVTCRLVPPKGKPYPEKGVRSRIMYKTLRPAWNEDIELPLLGGTLDTDGYYKSSDMAKSTLLHLSIRDADVGLWGIAYYCVRMIIFIILLAAIAAHIKGFTDNVTEQQQLGALVTILVVAVAYVVSYVMAVVLRADDEIIGICKVPLSMLLDQQEHALLLTLMSENEKTIPRTNSVHGLGVMRVRLAMSEH